jgi:NAD(P) transhydrogenase subunit alpha
VRVGVPRETAAGERRVALVPESVAKLTALGLEVEVEHDAGHDASFTDAAYADAGATIVPRALDADVVV